MSFKTLLVHVESDPASAPRLTLAIGLANQLQAKLIGVGAKFYNSSQYIGGVYDFGYGVSSIVQGEITPIEADLKQAEAKFRSAATALQNGSDWRAAIQLPLTKITAEACAADLLIASRSTHQDASDYDVVWPGALILRAGRPVLVVPPGIAKLNVKHVVVAWKDTRESRRAVSDSMPFLMGAEWVELVEICAGRDHASAAETRLTDVADHLLRHGVRASVKVDVADSGSTAAEQILDIAERQKADLIVAGGYGHSRLQELVFGGFTQALLAQTARAVMFSH